MLLPAQISFCYKKTIEAGCTLPWEKEVFALTYQEFKMQAQYYAATFRFYTFKELLEQNKAADKLHFLVSAAAISHLKQLNNIIPDICNNIGEQFLTFNQYRFVINNSDINQPAIHSVSIYFYSDPIFWLGNAGTFMLLTTAFDNDSVAKSTNLLQIIPNLQINSFKKVFYDNESNN